MRGGEWREVLQRSMSRNMHGLPIRLKASLTNVAFRRQRREGRKKGTQMVDFEKDTRRWWFSPRSWLWNLMRQSMASSTEPIWIRAILWSFLLKTERCISLVSGEDCLQFTTTIKENTMEEWSQTY